jgi:hypothetical protein
MEQLLGCINFGNTREGLALGTLHDALRDKAMWILECEKKDDEIERLKKLLARKRSHGCKVKRMLANGMLEKRGMRELPNKM